MAQCDDSIETTKNDLLNRISSFLPKIRAANEELHASCSKFQIDVTLAKASEGDSGNIEIHEDSSSLPRSENKMKSDGKSVVMPTLTSDSKENIVERQSDSFLANESVNKEHEKHQQTIEMDFSLGKIDNETMALLGPSNEESIGCNDGGASKAHSTDEEKPPGFAKRRILTIPTRSDFDLGLKESSTKRKRY